MNKKGFVLSTYVYILLVFFLLLLGTMLTVLNNSKLLSNKLKEQSGSTSGLLDNEYSFILLGDKEIIIPKDSKYEEPGYIAKTTKGVDISTHVSVIGNIDTSVTNEYTLTYKITYNGISKVLKRIVNVIDNVASNYIESLYKLKRVGNGLVQTTVEYNGVSYNAGLRYTGTNDAVKNQVYFNCEPIDGTNAYGTENYDYANDCEIWRIIGVFEVEDENGDKAQKLKIINTNSTFQASWDSSDSTINSGKGINQWGESGEYKGADLMQLLNGYYINKPNSECKYNTAKGQSGFAKTCAKESLVAAKMKPLTNVALGMATSVVWDTYAVNSPNSGSAESTYASSAYLQEKGISTQLTGSSVCISTGGDYCNDGITRTTSWIGLVGLMSVSDIEYANGWLYKGTANYPWTISPVTSVSYAYFLLISNSSSVSFTDAYGARGVWPALYLDSNVQIIGGNGDTTPYKLKI